MNEAPAVALETATIMMRSDRKQINILPRENKTHEYSLTWFRVKYNC